MKERELKILFSNFIKNQKGYPESSLLYDAPIKQTFKHFFNRYFADLLILDTEFNNYLALVEFKNSADDTTFKSAYERINQYLKALNNPYLSAYLIVQLDKDFEIYQFAEKKWSKIEKIEFPQYQTLKSKNEADTKILYDELNEKNITKKNQRKKF